MNGLNATFDADPLGFIENRAVNNLTWFRRAILPENGATLGMLNNAVNAAKAANVDLRPVDANTAEFNLVGGGGLVGDAPIAAYWCPFLQGPGLPGWVDIEKLSPRRKFVFTAAMNGCRLVVTDCSPSHFRVYHNQHPDGGDAEANRIWQLIAAQGHPIVGHFGYDEYGLVGGVPAAPNAFNFLYYRNSGWAFVSQPQTFDMVTLAVTRLPGRAMMRSIQ